VHNSSYQHGWDEEFQGWIPASGHLRGTAGLGDFFVVETAAGKSHSGAAALIAEGRHNQNDYDTFFTHGDDK